MVESNESYKKYAQEEHDSFIGKEIQEVEELHPEERIAYTVEVIDSAELEDEFADDLEQQELLEENKRIAKKKMIKVLFRVNSYLKAIATMEHKMKRRDLDVWEIEQLDYRRGIAHDTLMSEIDSANSFIRGNFAILDEDALENWESVLEDDDIEPVHIKRKHLPEFIFEDTSNRYYVTDWAVDIAEEFGKIV